MSDKSHIKKTVIARTFMPEIVTPGGGGGLSPTTNKTDSSFMAPNVFTLEDALNGKKYKLPGGGGSWSAGEDLPASFIEDGDEYKRKERDIDTLGKIINTPQNKEEWVLKVPGGKKTFNSLPAMLSYKRKMGDLGKQINYMTRTRTAQNNMTDTDLVAQGLEKTFKVEVANMLSGTMDVGECFCVDKNYFMTCAHVVKKYNKNTESTLNVNDVNSNAKINIVVDGRRIPATVGSLNAPMDMAILQANVNCSAFSVNTAPEIGEEILIIGSPHGFENNVSFGHIGSLDRKIYNHSGAPNYMFLDLSVFHGNSGGPVISKKDGSVIGMVTAIVAKNGEYGLNAGLPASYMQEFLNEFFKR